MKYFLALCFWLPLTLLADVTTSCKSTLSGAVIRANLSDICYTQDGGYFLQWQGYWDGNTNKHFTPVTGWQQSLDLMAIEADWRLPTIKELHSITTKTLVDVTNLPSDALAENWMVQQWLIRDASGAPLIPIADAYLLSSSYQGDNGNGTSKVLALNLATGLIEPLAHTDFDSKSVYMIKVKQSSPVWLNITTQYSGTAGHCLQHDDTLSNIIKVSTCDNSVQQKWLLEPNTGFIRSYSGGCLQAKSFANYADTTYETCSDYSTSVTPVNSDRWDALEVNSNKVFRSQSESDYYFYVASGSGGGTKKGEVLVWDYSSIANDNQNIWYY